MRKIYAGIDLGSDSIKIIVCDYYKNKYNILATSQVKSRGIKKGLIVNIEEVTKVIKEALKEVEGMLGVTVNKVIVIVPSYFADFKLVEGYSTITNEDKTVKGNDIVRALQACVYNRLPADRELVTVIPLEFNVDDKPGVRDPKGLVGAKLNVKAVMVTTPKKNVYSLVSVLEKIGIEVIDIVLGGIGDYTALRSTPTETCLGAVVNIGAETTNVSIFNRGIIIKNEVIQLGGRNIDNDLAYIYKLDKADAKEIKEKFAVANKRYAQINESYRVMNLYNEELRLNQYEVSEVVSSRIEEILNFVKKQINLLTNKEISYIIVTGGVSEMPGFNGVVLEVLGKHSYVADLNIMGVRNNKFSTLIGAIKYFNDKLILRGKDYSMFDKEKETDLISTKNQILSFSSDSVIGKVFGYFFDNN
ncbi:MAG: cell division protein FtsA [Bacilli bacterium]|jgi:cell division protein FtsA